LEVVQTALAMAMVRMTLATVQVSEYRVLRIRLLPFGWSLSWRPLQLARIAVLESVLERALAEVAEH